MSMASSAGAGGGLAVARMAEAMLRALGGASVKLLFPASGFEGTGAELGIETTPVEELEMGPVCRLAASSKDGHRRMEFMFPASLVGVHVEIRGMESAQEFFESALGIVQGSTLLRIESVASEKFGDAEYLYRVMTVE